MSPYRLPALETVDARHARADAGFAWLGSIVWVGSVARVIVGVIQRHALDQELALAFFLAIAIPWWMQRAFTKS